MADDGSAQSSTVWPLPKFYFKVDIGDQKDVPFQEISGLDTETQPIEYRAGNVTLKKGVFAKDNKFWDWYNQIKLNTIKRVPVTIQLCDEGGNPTMVWTL